MLNCIIADDKPLTIDMACTTAKKGIRRYTYTSYYKLQTHILVLAILVLLSACHSSKKMATTDKNNSIWAGDSNLIVVDGNNNDWKLPYPFIENRDAKIQYAIANDKQLLYLTLKTSDEVTRKKILKNGLAVCIDTNGKKDLTTTFNFTLEYIPPPTDSVEQEDPPNAIHMQGSQPSQPHDQDGGESHGNGGQDASGGHSQHNHGGRSGGGKSNGGNQGTAGQQGQQGKSGGNDKPTHNASDAQQLHISQIDIYGTARYNGSYTPMKNTTGIIVAVANNDFNEMVWEIAIPFKDFYKRVLDNSDANKKISVCFWISPLDQSDLASLGTPVVGIPLTADGPNSNGSGGNNGGAAPSGGGMGKGGGRGGGKMQHEDDDDNTPGNSAQDRERAVMKTQTWKQIKLQYQ